MDSDLELQQKVIKIVSNYQQAGGFIGRKLTDTPTDNLQVVPRKYVTLNGPSATRPTASVTGQFYFDTDIGKPVWWNGNDFVDATGTHA